MACKILHADLAQLGFDLFLADAESLGNAAARCPWSSSRHAWRETLMLLALRAEPGKLTHKLIAGQPGILAEPKTPGYSVPMRSIAASHSALPK